MYYCSLPQNNTLPIERGISLNVIWFDFVSVATVEILIRLSRFDPALPTWLVLLISELWSRARLFSCYAFKRQLLPHPCGTFVSLSGFPLNLEGELCTKILASGSFTSYHPANIYGKEKPCRNLSRNDVPKSGQATRRNAEIRKMWSFPFSRFAP